MEPELCAQHVHRLMTIMVNVYLVENGSGGWTLVDAGMQGFAETIRSAARSRFGSRPPDAIVLTHGHFDHVGSLEDLVGTWHVPVYAHRLELPYLTGRSSYPPADPSVGGGLWPWLAPLFPRGPINLGAQVRALPDDGSVPTLAGWRWIHTPGHTPGHVSLFRESDRTLIAGDAFVTTRQESISHVLAQREKVWRPPAYYTTDWSAAHRSVAALASLEPEVAATGHGYPMCGADMRRDLHALSEHFRDVVPRRGRYVQQPARADERGVVYVPPSVGLTKAQMAIGIGAVVSAGVLAARRLAARR